MIVLVSIYLEMRNGPYFQDTYSYLAMILFNAKLLISPEQLLEHWLDVNLVAEIQSQVVSTVW